VICLANQAGKNAKKKRLSRNKRERASPQRAQSTQREENALILQAFFLRDLSVLGGKNGFPVKNGRAEKTFKLMLRTLRSRYVAVLAKFSLLAHILRSKSGCFMVTA
jgi:hypothetical protein